MAINFKTIFNGLKLKAKAVLTGDSIGDLEVDSTTGKLNYHNGTSRSPVVTESSTATLTNKTITAPSGLTKSDVGLSNVDNTSDINKPVSTAQSSAITLKANIASPTFTGTVSGITSTMVGLGNVDNTSDANKPVSTAQATAIGLKINSSEKGAANGVATLDSNSLIPITQLPPAAIERLVIVANQTARFALTTTSVQNGDTVKQTDTGLMYFVKDDTNLASSLGYEAYTAGTASAVAWSGITSIPTPVSSLTGTNTGDQTASTISNTPSGNLAATTVQAALNELQSDIDTRLTGIVPIANGGTNASSQTAPAGNIAPIAYFDGTKITTDATPSHLGYDTTTDTVYSSSINIASATTQTAKFTNTAASSSSGGAGMVGFSDDGAALASGDRLGFYALGGSKDAAHTTSNALAITGITTENWSGTATGAKLQFEVTANGGTTRSVATTINQDKSLSNAGIIESTTGGFKFPDGTTQTTAASGSGGTGVGSVNILNADQADTSVLSSYTQTGLEIVSSPVIHGTNSFRLQHNSSIKSFKKVIAVDSKFRGKNLTLSLDVLSSATSGNLNIVITDETNSIVLAASQPIATNSQAITATAVSTATLSGMDTATFNKLKVGMLITGTNIPVGTTITALSTSALTATMSAASTSTAASIRISDLPATKSFSFDVPANCLSLSWTISSVVEASVESYIDDVVLQLTASALSSTSITIPTNNNYDWTNYTPTVTNNTNVTASIQHSRSFNIMKLRGRLTWSGAGATTPPKFVLPNSQSILSTVTPGLTLNTVQMLDAAVQEYQGIAVVDSLTTIRFNREYATGVQLASDASLSWTPNTGDIIEFYIEVPIQGWSANETTSTIIPLTTAQLVQQSDSILRVQGGNGLSGSVRLFSNILDNLGSSISYNAANGTFTILESGLYDTSYSDATAATSAAIGITKNDTTFSGTSTMLAAQQNGASESIVSCSSAGVYLVVGDIIRGVTSGTMSTNSAYAHFSISKQGSLKQLNPSSDSKITIPTHQLRFEGASSRGSTDTAIVKFDTQAITQGDAWDVINTAANGTVVTMKKAGRLNIDCQLYIAAQNYYITLNEVNLTSPAVTAGISLAESSVGIGQVTPISKTIDTKVGDKIRIVASAAPTARADNSFSLYLTETSIPANFSNVLPQWSQSDSSVRLDVGNGFGSTNTLVRRFANNPDNLGTAITYADSATLGMSAVVNEDGLYDISYTEQASSVADVFLTKNQTTATVGANILASDSINSTAGDYLNMATQVYLLKNDTIRAVVGNAAAISSSSTMAKFTISKVGKPNLTSVDVTPFVNMKTTDTQSSTLLQSATFALTTITGVLTSNTNNGIYRYDSATGIYTALKSANVWASAAFNSSTANGSEPVIKLNGVNLTMGTTYPSTGYRAAVSASFQVVTGDTWIVANNQNANTSSQYITILATADNNATASPTQQVSSDTMNFAFKATAIDPAVDAIGTFNTYTYAANTNTATIGATAPTQTVSSMNINGVQVFARAYNATSTTASPARVDIFIGKGLKSKQVDAYSALAKVSPISTDHYIYSTTNEYGTAQSYNEITGILTINAGLALIAGITYRAVGQDISTNSDASSGYFVINASKSPSLVTIPQNVSVSALYTGAPPTGTLTTAFNTTTFGTKVKDSHGAYSSGSYTVPLSGCYDISATVAVTGTFVLNDAVITTIFIDGVGKYDGYTRIFASETQAFPQVNVKSIPLLAGQVVTIRTYSAGTGLSFIAGSTNNFFSISKSGSY